MKKTATSSSSSSRPTVLIADDHDLVLEALKARLDNSAKLQCIGTVRDGLSAIVETRILDPDLLVLDLGLPGAGGIEVLGEIRRWSKRTRILVLTGQTSPAVLRSVLEARADGIAVKTSPIAEIEDGMSVVLSGCTWLSRDAEDILGSGSGRTGLTPREFQVLTMVIGGLTNREIGARLSISPKTVDNHRTRLMAKLGVRSRTELLSYALRHGLLDPSR
jgi:DNA-binding NarL/FixJ family response regulator